MLTVASLMSRRLVTVSPHCSLERARARLDERELRHLPVVDEGRLVGILSERDLLASPPGRPDAQERAPEVRDRMETAVETVQPRESVSVACRRMHERRISCLAVVRGGGVVGMITELDLMRLFVRTCRFAGHDPALDPRVEARASEDIVVVPPDTTVREAYELCRSKGIRHLPIARDGWVVGMVSDRDLLPSIGRPDDENRMVGEVMTPDYVAIVPGTPLSAAAERMLESGFHSLPVIADGVLRGIVTSADVLAALCRIPDATLASGWSSEAALSADAEES